MFYYTRLLLLFFWTFATWNLGAAALKEVPFPYSVQRITPESGVTYDGIRDAIQDSQGFVWILSDNDLFRFDGYTFKRYTNVIQGLDQISNLSFFCLEIDSRDCLYIGMKDGVVCYDTRYDKVKMVSSLATRALVFDNSDCLWMLGDEVGYYVLSERRYARVDDSAGRIIRNSFAAAFDDRYVYIGTTDGVIYKYDGNGMAAFPPPPRRCITSWTWRAVGMNCTSSPRNSVCISWIRRAAGRSHVTISSISIIGICPRSRS